MPLFCLRCDVDGRRIRKFSTVSIEAEAIDCFASLCFALLPCSSISGEVRPIGSIVIVTTTWLLHWGLVFVEVLELTSVGHVSSCGSDGACADVDWDVRAVSVEAGG